MSGNFSKNFKFLGTQVKTFYEYLNIYRKVILGSENI